MPTFDSLGPIPVAGSKTPLGFYPAVPPPGVLPYPQKIAEGIIEIPTLYVVLDIPDNFDFFRLQCSSISIGGADATPVNSSLGITFSYDNGVTWLFDAVNFDTYIFNGKDIAVDFVPPTLPPFAVHDFGGTDTIVNPYLSNLVLTDGVDYTNGILASTETTFTPGSSIALPSGECSSIWSGNLLSVPKFCHSQTNFSVNPSSVIPPPAGRVNKLLIQAYGDGNVPQPLNITIQPGTTYALWGF